MRQVEVARDNWEQEVRKKSEFLSKLKNLKDFLLPRSHVVIIQLQLQMKGTSMYGVLVCLENSWFLHSCNKSLDKLKKLL
jgi:hypothetical protein